MPARSISQPSSSCALHGVQAEASRHEDGDRDAAWEPQQGTADQAARPPASPPATQPGSAGRHSQCSSLRVVCRHRVAVVVQAVHTQRLQAGAAQRAGRHVPISGARVGGTPGSADAVHWRRRAATVAGGVRDGGVRGVDGRCVDRGAAAEVPRQVGDVGNGRDGHAGDAAGAKQLLAAGRGRG